MGAAAFCFLVPIGMGLVLAALAPSGVGSRSLATLAGLVSGLVLTVTIARLGAWYRSGKEVHRG